MSADEQRRWREWFDWAVRPGGEFWSAEKGCAVIVAAVLDGAGLAKVEPGGGGARTDVVVKSGTDLTLADLRGADLRSARLDRAVLNRALLQKSDLSNARLNNAVFTGADLSEATIHATDLTQVDFKDARLFATRDYRNRRGGAVLPHVRRGRGRRSSRRGCS